MTDAAPWAGTDEVGRGCLAGPVVAAAVAWHAPPAFVGQLRDSKKLSPQRREKLAVMLLGESQVRWAVAWADPATIDRCNILQASLQSMVGAVTALGPLAGVRVDGNQRLPIDLPQETVVGGDDLVAEIAAASILAKVFRDRWMACLADEYPEYGWERNRGYGSAEHMAALDRLGPTPWHRRSFAPVAQRTLALGGPL
jgi:ribonuclease HII